MTAADVLRKTVARLEQTMPQMLARVRSEIYTWGDVTDAELALAMTVYELDVYRETIIAAIDMLSEVAQDDVRVVRLH